MVVEEPDEVCGVLVGVVDPLPVEEPEAVCGAVLVLLVDDAGAVVGVGVAAEVLVVVGAGDELVVVVGAVLCGAACGAVAC